jgi:hypothetical protein
MCLPFVLQQFKTGSYAASDTLSGTIGFWWTGQETATALPADPTTHIDATSSIDCENVRSPVSCVALLCVGLCPTVRVCVALQTFNSLPNVGKVQCFVQAATVCM